MTDTDLLDGYLTKQDTADQLGVTIKTLDRWNQLRSGPPRTMMGGTVLYRVDSLRSWLKAQEQEPPRRART